MRRVVIINSYDKIHEGLVRRGHDIAGRPQEDIPMRVQSNDFRSLPGLDYSKEWAFIRKITYKSLHMYGKGMQKIEEVVNEEADKMCDLMRNDVGNEILLAQLGADVQMLLITAYQAIGQRQEAITLCQELTNHPNMLIREKAKSVLYIINAPELQRPAEWMSEIPELSEQETAKPLYVTTKRKNTQKKKQEEIPEIDWSKVNTEDNQFIWFALGLAIITLGSLIWLT